MKNKLLTRSLGIGALFFVSVLSAQDTETIIRDYIAKESSFKKTDNNFYFKVLTENNSSSLSASIVDVQESYNSIPIYKSLAKAVIRDGQIVFFDNNFQKNNKKPLAPKIDKSIAFSKALNVLGIRDFGFKLMSETEEMVNLPDNKVANMRFYFEKDNNLIPAQLFFVNNSKENYSFSFVVSLLDGSVLEKNNMIIECAFDMNHLENEDTSQHFLSHINNKSDHHAIPSVTKAVTNATYNVFPFPVEAPTFGNRFLVTNPWDLASSPEGWHSNGTKSFTNTYGNNVLAYVDNDATNQEGFSPESSASGSLMFDFPYQESPDLSAYNNKSSAVTNLFYANNMIHDIFYKFGFVESSRNFQTNNFGNGGFGFDAVRAEAFDGSGYNNANFSSGYEISSSQIQAPRMQMFLWNNRVVFKQRLFYTNPDLLSRAPVNTGIVSFANNGAPGYYVGKYLMENGVTGDVVSLTDPSMCTAQALGSLLGKIPLVSMTGCTYDVKIKNAQNAGAVGVIVHRTTNSVSDINLSAALSSNINIPTITLPLNEGNFIKNKVTNGEVVNVNLKDPAVGYKNSSFDNGVMIHEYGHGISNRLTGKGYNCLTNLEQMGEGWSDFFALMLTNIPSYTATKGRGIGTYAFGQDPQDLGIRTYRYTTDMSANPFTYASTNSTGGQPHAVGQIWATMLWDLHWKMAEKYGYNYDVTADPNSGSAKALQLVVDGLKLQPCNPDFVSGRNAILQADALKGGVDECLIWEVFAKRGLGLTASSGSPSNISDQVENFELPEKCKLAINEVSKDKAYNVYPNPAKGEFFIKGKPTLSLDKVKVEILDVSGKLVKSFERNKNAIDAISTRGMAKGVYIISITEGGKLIQADKLIVE